jgi:MFS-type transporter involved in bile tolerance (Atg22 family)
MRQCKLRSGRNIIIIIIIIIIVIIINIISFMQGIYTYIPETNNVPREYIVAAILLLLFMVPIISSSCVGSSLILC